MTGRLVVYIGDDPDIAWDDPLDAVKHGEIGVCLEHRFTERIARYSSMSVLFGDRVVSVCESEIRVVD